MSISAPCEQRIIHKSIWNLNAVVMLRNLCRNNLLGTQTCLRSATKRFSSVPTPKNSSFASLLTDRHVGIINNERILLTQLLQSLHAMDASQEDLDLISDTRSRIDDLFMVVIVGEFNAGKSTFINSLLGAKYLKDGVLPTTSKICILRCSSDSDIGGVWKKADNMLLDDVEVLGLPLDWLKHIAIIDTPGTNAVVARHEQLTQKIVPRADLVLFVTSAERPISESESLFLSKISDWGKKVCVIVNKMDILQSSDDRKAVMEYVAQNVSKILGSNRPVPIFSVSSRNALNSKLLVTSADGGHMGDPALGVGARLWHESQLAAVEDHLKCILGHDGLIRSKLENPLGVADRVIVTALACLEERQTLLSSDLRVLAMIKDNMSVFEQDMHRDVKYCRQNLGSILNKISVQADEFFEDNITIFKPSLLMNPSEFQKEFQRQVLIDLTKPVDDVVKDVTQLVSDRARVQARAIMEYVNLRPQKLHGQTVGGIIGGSVKDVQFDNMRQDLMHRLRTDTQDVLLLHNQSKDLLKMSEQIRVSLIQAAALQAAGAGTVGGLVAMHMLDVTGVLAASSLAVAGLVVVPWRKQSMRKQFNSRLKTLATRLDDVIADNFEREMRAVAERILDTVTPYTRFVEIEQKKVLTLQEKFTELRHSVRLLHSETQNL